MWEVMKINMDIDGLNEKSVGGILFTGLGLSPKYVTAEWEIYARIRNLKQQKQYSIRIIQ